MRDAFEKFYALKVSFERFAETPQPVGPHERLERITYLSLEREYRFIMGHFRNFLSVPLDP